MLETDTDLNTRAKTLLDLAKIDLLGDTNSVFLTTVLFSMEFVWDTMENMPCKTLYTNGIKVGIHKEFFVSRKQKSRMTVLAHEAWHVCFRHMTRRGDRNPLIWNFAGDFLINLQLYNDGFRYEGDEITCEDIVKYRPDAEPKEGWLLDRKYKGYTTDQIYDDLMDGLKKELEENEDLQKVLEGLKDWGPGFGEDLVEEEEDENGDAQGKSAIDAQIDDILIKAKVAANMAGDESVGNLPGEISRYLEELVDPKVPWQTLLYNHLSAFNKDDYSYRVPDKRFINNDDEDSDVTIMPSLYSEALGEITMWCDLSGSVGDDDLISFFSEARFVKETMNPSKLTIGSFDDEINTVNELTTEDDFSDIKMIGGGGTDIIPVIEWLNEREPEIAIIFTDGEFWGNWSKGLSYKKELIWLIYDNPGFTAPFGRVIHY